MGSDATISGYFFLKVLSPGFQKHKKCYLLELNFGSISNSQFFKSSNLKGESDIYRINVFKRKQGNLDGKTPHCHVATLQLDFVGSLCK